VWWLWGVIMVGSLGDTCWSNFCTGNCVAICTGSGMTSRSVVWDGSVFADVFVNAIKYQWYCVGIWQGCGRLDQLAVQCQTYHGPWQMWCLPM